MSDHTEGKPKRDRGRRRRGGRSGAPRAEAQESREQGQKREAQSRGGTQKREGSRGDNRSRGRGDQGSRREGSARRDSRRDDAFKADALSRRDSSRQDNRPRERRIEIDLPPPPKLPTPVCSRCGEAIQDLSSALSDRESGEPIHFDCALRFLEGSENVSENQKIVYVGQGRFAVMEFENPQDTKKFRILRTLEWESREHRAEWRSEVANLFSQVR